MPSIESKHFIYVADACFSGSSSGGRGFRKDTGTKDFNLSDDFSDKMTKGKNRVIMTASEANELALESDELSSGIFTHYFLEGLKGTADADEDNQVSDQEVYDYLREKVIAKTKRAADSRHS